MSSSAASTIRPPKPCPRSASAALAPARPPPAMTKVSETGIASLLSLGAEGGGEPLAEVVPARVKRAHALVFQGLDDVGVVDAQRCRAVEDGPGVCVGAVDAVAGDVAVVGDRVQRGLGHGVDHAGGDQAGDVAGVVV